MQTIRTLRPELSFSRIDLAEEILNLVLTYSQLYAQEAAHGSLPLTTSRDPIQIAAP